jgi:hypothetical protein
MGSSEHSTNQTLKTQVVAVIKKVAERSTGSSAVTGILQSSGWGKSLFTAMQKEEHPSVSSNSNSKFSKFRAESHKHEYV